jgi:D-3-phosphoglycerate dehydrogenase
MNTPGQNSNAVAELCFGMMVDLARGHYQGKSGFELRGKVLGLHAYGNVSKYMALIAKGFGMEVCAVDPYVSDDVFAKDGVKKLNTVEELYSTCDYISIHCPLTAETKGMVNEALLSKMKCDATLINSARDAIIDESALQEKLEKCAKFKYGADVAPKIAKELSEKFGARVLFTTAKMGAQTEEANTNSGVAAVNQAMEFLEKGVDKFRVKENKF